MPEVFETSYFPCVPELTSVRNEVSESYPLCKAFWLSQIHINVPMNTHRADLEATPGFLHMFPVHLYVQMALVRLMTRKWHIII